MFGEFRNMHTYIEGLDHLNQFRDEFDELWPSHADIPVYPDQIDKLRRAAERLLAGDDFPYKTEFMYGENVRLIDVGCATFLCPDKDPRKL